MKNYLRNKIRKWLKSESPKVLTDEEATAILDGHVKKMIGDAVEELLGPDLLEYYSSIYFGDLHYLRGKVDSLIKYRVQKILKDQLPGELGKVVDPEAFIDKIVKRIRDKQI